MRTHAPAGIVPPLDGRCALVDEVAQGLRVVAGLELGQGLGLDLTDALAGDAVLLADFFEGAGVLTS